MVYIITVISLFILYSLLALIVHQFQKSFIFRPIKLDKDYRFNFKAEYEELWLDNISGGKINCLHFRTNNPKGVVLYHHGNSRNLQHWGQFYEDFTSRGYDVFFYDYRTFGKSEGKLTEASLYRDARKCYKHLLTQYDSENIIQYGRSLGSALATRMTRKFGSRFLILETPYLSMKAMAEHKFPFLPIGWILNFHLRQDLDIKLIKSPILIITGTEDELTPHNHSLALSKLSTEVELAIIEKGTHNGLPEHKIYDDAMDRYFLAIK